MFPDGWDYGDVLKLAGHISRMKRWRGTGMQSDIYNIAHDVVSRLLVEGQTNEGYLVTAASHAISREVGRYVPVISRDPDRFVPQGRVVAYWWDFLRTTPNPSNKVVEELGLWQAFGALSDEDKRVLSARAVTSTDGEAGQKLGMSQASFSRSISRARKNFHALWFDHEAPCKTSRRTFEPAHRAFNGTHKTSGYTFTLPTGRVKAYITAQGKRKYVGTYSSDAEANEVINARLQGQEQQDQGSRVRT